jgi:hypothetical protein
MFLLHDPLIKKFEYLQSIETVHHYYLNENALNLNLKKIYFVKTGVNYSHTQTFFLNNQNFFFKLFSFF